MSSPSAPSPTVSLRREGNDGRSLRVALEAQDENIMSSQEQQDDQERFDKQVAGGSDDLDDLGKLGTAPTPPPMIKTATYPNNLPQKNQLRRFARSAQKRQSVQLLGSIEHLQHHFMKFGLAAEETPNVRGISASPAVGSALHTSSSSATGQAAHELRRPSQLGLASSSSSSPRDTPAALLPATPLVPPPMMVPSMRDLPKVDLGALKREAAEGVRAVKLVWSLDTTEAHTSGADGLGTPADAEELDILDLLRTTVLAIRAVRAYSLAAPASTFSTESYASHSIGGGRDRRPGLSVLGVPGGKPRQSISTPSRPALRVVSLGGPAGDGAGAGSSSTANQNMADPLSDVRKAALDVLAGLRAVEERTRVEVETFPASSEPASHDSETSSTMEPGSSLDGDMARLSIGETSVSSSSCRYDVMEGTAPASSSDGLLELDDWEEDEGMLGQNGSERKESWMDKIIDGKESGWTYRSGAVVERDFAEERALVERYVVCVERSILPSRAAAASAGGSRGRRGLGFDHRRVSAEGRLEHDNGSLGGGEGGLADVTEESRSAPVPEWVRRDWGGKAADRIHGFLAHHLPLEHLPLLPHPTSEGFELALLTRLSDGYFLALAFNDVIARSSASWGVIPHEDIHDTLDDGGKDWTFRKIRNLTAWAAAIKLRYALPVTLPQHRDAERVRHLVPLQQTYQGGQGAATAELVTTAATPSSNSKAGINSTAFDPAVVAKREADGWAAALIRLCSAWLDRIAAESSTDRGGQ